VGFRIKTVSDRTGIPRGTLLAWERRYGLPSPDRQGNGYREYSEADVDRLSAVKRLVDAGHKVSEAISLLEAAAVVEGGSLPPVEEVPARLLSELARFRRQEPERLLGRLTDLGLARVVASVYLPLAEAIDAQEVAGVLTGAQARYARSFCHDQLVALRMGLGSGPSGAPRAVVAGPPGSTHDLDLLAIAVLLSVHGWRVNWLGLEASAADLCALIEGAPPSLLCISGASVELSAEEARWRAAIHARLPADLPVLVGAAAVLRQLKRGAVLPGELRTWSH
jgi:DNA-binding transcriptional MerR regulator